MASQATQATQATRVKRVWLVLKVRLAQLACEVLLGYTVKMDQKGNKVKLDLKVIMELVGYRGVQVRRGRREREASRVIWDLQVHQEKLLKEEAWDKRVTKARREIQATRVRKENKV